MKHKQTQLILVGSYCTSPFMMDEIWVTAGDRCVKGCALDKPSEKDDGSERATIETEPEKEESPSGIPLYMLSI